jgi:hypothetical protein
VAFRLLLLNAYSAILSVLVRQQSFNGKPSPHPLATGIFIQLKSHAIWGNIQGGNYK